MSAADVMTNHERPLPPTAYPLAPCDQSGAKSSPSIFGPHAVLVRSTHGSTFQTPFRCMVSVNAFKRRRCVVATCKRKKGIKQRAAETN